MKVGDLVEVGVKGSEELVVGVLIEHMPAEKQRNAMHFVQVLHQDELKWWPLGYVRKVSKDVKMD